MSPFDQNSRNGHASEFYINDAAIYIKPKAFCIRIYPMAAARRLAHVKDVQKKTPPRRLGSQVPDKHPAFARTALRGRRGWLPRDGD
ncbi:hypothetical protein [Allopusillimonas soli]|uniref:hypothetical protein n=1 Tax=Allopusillimonas soli TaxID=659016 RepID=UPI001431DED2|nr:hypothetical protein [Allopusillimonas soli]